MRNYYLFYQEGNRRHCLQTVFMNLSLESILCITTLIQRLVQISSNCEGVQPQELDPHIGMVLLSPDH